MPFAFRFIFRVLFSKKAPCIINKIIVHLLGHPAPLPLLSYDIDDNRLAGV